MPSCPGQCVLPTKPAIMPLGMWTKTGVRLSEVPDVVRRTLQSSQYGTWVIDDVDLYESPDRVWYAIEVEDPQSEREATVRILEDGTLL